jgi:hypothetical protein
MKEIMLSNTMQQVFVERISNVAHANGIFRITLGVNKDPNNIQPVVELLIPGTQVGSILQGISNAAKEIGQQIQLRVEKETSPKEGNEGQVQRTNKKNTTPKRSAQSQKTVSKRSAPSKKKTPKRSSPSQKK